MEVKKTPAVVYAESTPNPSTMKFVANRLLVENDITVEYNDLAQAKESPLAQKIFNFPFVKGVFMASNFISVTKNDLVAWDYVALELREFIQNYLFEGHPIFTNIPSQNADNHQNNEVFSNTNYQHAEAKSEIDQRIIDLLEEYVRPAVEQDGGAIFFQSFQEGTVTLSLKGACSGCPSSTFTLKAGIEGLLKRMIPEVNEVVAEAY
jgi:Fe-S cluster biogenesis protein NfuA